MIKVKPITIRYSIIIIKNTIIVKYFFVLLSLFALACASEKHQASEYYTVSERDSLLKNIVIYIYNKAPGASNTTKWEKKYSEYYNNSLPSFHLENYSIGTNGWHYYFVIRPVGGSNKKRGVIGKFKLVKNSLKPVYFEETINTPHLDQEIVQERGQFLFNEFLKNDNLDKYLGMKHFIEWPDNALTYNKNTNSWEVPTHKLFSNLD
jgi:hypothetical protein